MRISVLLPVVCGGLVIAGSVAAQSAKEPPRSDARAALVLARQGSFEAGGRIIGDAEKSQSCDHGHVEYQIPVKARALPLFLWHSSSAAVWQRRWDGGEGFQSIFLRRGFATYVWDGPRVGRANYGCEDYTYQAMPGRDEAGFVAWRFGPRPMEWFPGLQFPAGDPEAWNQARRARYDEFDTVQNAEIEAAAAAKALDRIGPSVLVTNSAGGLRAMLTAIKSDNVAAIVAYENPGFVLLDEGQPKIEPGPYGPVYVSAPEFDRLTRIPIQLVWGDNIGKAGNWHRSYAASQAFVRTINARGGKAEILHLPDKGLRGNTHIPFADLNNVAVADLLSAFLHQHGLDRRPKRGARQSGTFRP
ncbi:alpha/beta hydrolase [Sphingomonas soli]|uniref:alpha/beta hydrolase n=1 Tax=Sphingomonas soli TaxID=266127 RepID=UPI000A076324|nr:alpha/beta fold hydrolase [Sphingomonas soli]